MRERERDVRSSVDDWKKRKKAAPRAKKKTTTRGVHPSIHQIMN
tara:strand:+ start:658 stop:789 length:132 start_codon:yes stop_codon:yes gene_type:complete